MTPSELKRKYHESNNDGCYFLPETMKYFGDTMRNYGVRQVGLDNPYYWELWRKQPVKGGRQGSAYFDSNFNLIS